MVTQVEHDAGVKLRAKLIAQGLQRGEVRGSHGGAGFDFDSSHRTIGLFPVSTRCSLGALTRRFPKFGDHRHLDRWRNMSMDHGDIPTCYW